MDLLTQALALPLYQALLFAFFVFAAGLCRGITGFGLSAIVIGSMTPFLAPSEVVPIAVALEVLASLMMLRRTWRDVDWPLLTWLMIGAVLGVPLGVYLLAWVPPDWVRVFISLFVGTAALLLLVGWNLGPRRDRPSLLSVGFGSGVANGLASVGGLVLAIFFMASAVPATLLRATLNIYFLIIDIYETGHLYLAGLLFETTLWRILFLAVPLAVGLWLGDHVFKRLNSAQFRRLVLALLMLLASIGLVRVLLF